MGYRDIQQDILDGIAGQYAENGTIVYKNQTIDLTELQFNITGASCIRFEGCTFTTGDATVEGPLFRLDDSASAQLSFQSCMFYSIAVASGGSGTELGSLLSAGSGSGDVTFTSCRFKNITVTGDSLLDFRKDDDSGSFQGSLTIDTCTFNTYKGYLSLEEGFLDLNSSTDTIIRNTVLSNTVTAGIFNRLDAPLYLEGAVTFSSCLDGTLIVSEDGNLTLAAGASLADGASIQAGGDCTITNNSGIDNSSIVCPEGLSVSLTGGTGEINSLTELKRVGAAGGWSNFAEAVQGALRSVVFLESSTCTESYLESGIASVSAPGKLIISGENAQVTLEDLIFDIDGNDTDFRNLNLNDSIFLGGDGQLAMDNVTLGGTSTRIYGGGEISASEIFGDATLRMDKVTLAAGKTNIYGACNVTGEDTIVNSRGSISTTVKIKKGTATFYGGARVYGNGGTFSGSVNLNSISTYISGGTFNSFLGNGSQASGGNVTQGTSSLSILNCTCNNYVYGGGYSQGSMTTVYGDINLCIEGGTYQKNIFGGCAANTNKLARNTKIIGDVNILIECGYETYFGEHSHIIAGSQSCKSFSTATPQIYGNTCITFSGVGFLLHFAEDTYVMGGSQLDRYYSKLTGTPVNSVSGTRTLKFYQFMGDFNANIDETFDTVTVSESKVTLKGGAVSLKDVTTWNIDVSHPAYALLTWTDGVNDFAGDVINLINWNPCQEGCIIEGDDSTLKNFAAAEIHVFTSSGRECTSDEYYITFADNVWMLNPTRT